MMMTVFPVTVSACCLCCLNHGPGPACPGVPVPPHPDQFRAVNKAVLSVYTHLSAIAHPADTQKAQTHNR